MAAEIHGGAVFLGELGPYDPSPVIARSSGKEPMEVKISNMFG
jgi:hypothetical protein